MLAEERFCEILNLVEERKTITVQELTERLQSSESTIRRDLTTLHKKGRLIKVHGGATAVDLNYTTKDAAVADRQELNIEEKIKIGKYAAGLIERDDFVYIDAGTSTEYLIDYISEKDAVYVTNGIIHAGKLIRKGCRVFILGGELKASTEAIIGSEAVNGLLQYNFTKGFFGANGIHKEHGFTTPEMHEAAVKRKALEQCREKYILADSSKINQISPVKFADFKEATILTTGLKEPSLRTCRNIVEVE